LRSKKKSGGVYLTYAADLSGDGLGAQAQRLMGIFSAAGALDFGYVHTPIKSIEVNPGDPHTTKHERDSYLCRVNQFFRLPSEVAGKSNSTWSFRSLSNRKIVWLRVVNTFARMFSLKVLIELPSSLPWSDANPDSYRKASDIIAPRVNAREKSTVTRIDIHIRRAVAPKVGRDGKAYDRYVPTEWYLDVLNFVVPFLRERGLKCELRIHTDMPEGRWKVPEDTTPGTLAMWKHHNFIDADGYLIDMSENLRTEFSKYGSVEMAQGWDPLEAIESMAQADILILCASSLSYVAGLLRGDRLTISPYFFHSPPSSWSQLSSDFVEGESERLLAQLKGKFD
jgi:hypothetical protein